MAVAQKVIQTGLKAFTADLQTGFAQDYPQILWITLCGVDKCRNILTFSPS
jgi:hypothetical protein